MDELIVYGLWVAGPVGLITILLLLWNLMSAPFRLECRRHDDLKNEIIELRKLNGYLTSENEELKADLQNPGYSRVDPMTGATVIGHKGGPMSIVGGVFQGGIKFGDNGDKS